MRVAIQVGLFWLAALGIAAGVVTLVNRSSREQLGGIDPARGKSFGQEFVEDSGYGLAASFTAAVEDRSSLEAVRKAVRERGRRGIASLRQEMEAMPADDERRPQREMFIGLLHMYDGEFDEAAQWFGRAADNPTVPSPVRANIIALRGVASLRRGEVENCVACVGPSSCLFPIAPEAVHLRPEGSRAALGDFTTYLREWPDDVGVRWLLNIASMTLGEYPERLSSSDRIPLEPFRSKHDAPRFDNVALLVGLDSRGQNMAGGSVFDDFTGDGRPDILVGTIDCDLGASLFVNRGDGKFEDRGSSVGIADQFLSFNTRQADYDNDGRLDVLLVRGGWEDPCPLSLLHNVDGKFVDVTTASGLGVPIATESAEWGDYDNDGLVDLFVAGETRAERPADPRNQCRLYHNAGGGKFIDVAAKAGVTNDRWTKGASWGDYDNDGRIDLYVSNREAANRLYHNNGDGTFTDVAERLEVTGPHRSFSCWFWDYDNDGRLDIFASAFSATLNDYINDVLGQPSHGERPRLYRNLGPEGFRDVTKETGLDRVIMAMGSNFADIDNDGYLDMYIGTGTTTYSSLVPNLMFRNAGGERFDDVTLATGTGHLQKGHGVSFADWDGDGNLDLFVVIGGSVPGDRGHNSLFQNAGQGRHWLDLKLVGTRSNRSAIGARVRVDYQGSDGRLHSVHRVVGSGSSFGGNSLVVHVGLASAGKAEAVSVTWPVGGTVQAFANVVADQALEITEGAEAYRKLPAERLKVPAAP